MIKITIVEGDVFEQMRRLLKDALASSEPQMITVEAVEMAPKQLVSQGERDPESETGGQKSAVECPGDYRRPLHLNVSVKTTVNGKKAGNRLPKRDNGDRLAGKVNPSAGFRASGERATGEATDGADGRGKPVSRGPKPASATDGGAMPGGVLRSVNNWNEVVLSGETISLRNREKAKELLRFLEAGGATRRTKAIAVGKQFGKPSALFLPGGRYVRDGAGSGGREVAVGSQLGALIQRVYREGVGKVPPARKSTGAMLYYLRVLRDSDVT